MSNNEAYGDPKKDAARPYRLWNPAEGKWYMGCWYLRARTAYDGAVKLMNWAQIGTVIEVLDVRKMKEIGTYKRTVHGISVSREELPREEQ